MILLLLEMQWCLLGQRRFTVQKAPEEGGSLDEDSSGARVSHLLVHPHTELWETMVTTAH